MHLYCNFQATTKNKSNSKAFQKVLKYAKFCQLITYTSLLNLEIN